VGDEHWPKLQIVHCGVDPDDFRPQAASDRRDDVVEIITVGRLARSKGQAILLSALAELRSEGLDARLTVIGDGELAPHLQKMAASLGIAEVVRFEGAVGQDDIRDYYRRADLFCLSSFAEGVPVVLMEAMSMGLPVVAPNIMGVPELVDDGENGLLVSPGRSDQLASAIRRLAGDPELRRELGAAGRRKVSMNFHISQSAETLANAFAELTQSGSICGPERESSSAKPMTVEPLEDIPDKSALTARLGQE
jgi:colanic acid/amylovoran biosynthesis glycosyltransferase